MLTRLGLYYGPVSGQLDQVTLASFTTWLFSHRLPAKTPLNAKTLNPMAKDLGDDNNRPKTSMSDGTKHDSPSPWLVILGLSLALPL